MARKTIAVVFHAEDDEVDEIIENLKRLHDIDVVHIQQSYGRLWIKHGDAP